MSFLRGGAFERRSTASLVFGLFVAGGLVLVFAGTLARSTDLRTAPELHFVIDRGLEHARRIDNLLAAINRPESES